MFCNTGSAAAAWQASIGPVAARGLFATLQSAGAMGYGAPIVNGVVQAVGGALALWGWMTGRRREDEDEEGGDDDGGDSYEGGEGGYKREGKGEEGEVEDGDR